jgi:F-type H+-transporting ATPase subunit delta
VPDRDVLVHGYAEALFSVAEAEGALGSIENELFAFAKAVEQNTELRQALTDPGLPAENKKAVIHELLGDRANPLTASLLGFVVESGRSRELGRIVQELATVAAERRQHALAEVRSAVPLSDEQRNRLAAALARATGKTLEVKVVVDPSVIGGVVANVGDEVFDGSVRTRLAEAKQHLGSM